jgi:proteasome lid subunit RPN8/RPN11
LRDAGDGHDRNDDEVEDEDEGENGDGDGHDGGECGGAGAPGSVASALPAAGPSPRSDEMCGGTSSAGSASSDNSHTTFTVEHRRSPYAVDRSPERVPPIGRLPAQPRLSDAQLRALLPTRAHPAGRQPFRLRVGPEVPAAMRDQAFASAGREVIGLLGGSWHPDRGTVTVNVAYLCRSLCADAADMDPVSERETRRLIEDRDCLRVVGWFRSQPESPAVLRVRDLEYHCSLQALCDTQPFVAAVVSTLPEGLPGSGTAWLHSIDRQPHALEVEPID